MWYFFVVMSGPSPIALSGVEQRNLATSPCGVLYSHEEKLPTIVGNTFPVLGKPAAIRFPRLVQSNPEEFHGIVLLNEMEPSGFCRRGRVLRQAAENV
ncbi:MAG: hypothetical protein VX733_04545 [Candidatus Latescibacterota bacterium]|nr:hypothetical protein [Candidatus Latescibacterota bacterium]